MAQPAADYVNGVFHVVLDAGTPGERGEQHGAALRLPIRTALRNFKSWMRVQVGLEDPGDAIAEFVESSGHLAAATVDAPDLVEEMRGVAAASGVDLVELFAYQSFDELFVHFISSGALDPSSSGHCTTAAIAGRPGLSNLIGHNNDIPTYHEGLVTVLRIKDPALDVEILQSTFAGQLGQNGVNSLGVGVGINTLADLPGGSGVPVSFHVRRILQTHSVGEAADYLSGARFGQAMNYMIADRSRAVSVESWQTAIAVMETGEGGALAHTNHSVIPNTPRTFEMDASSGGGSYGHTHERLALAQQILRDEPLIDLAGFREIFQQRPILVFPGKPTGRTLMNMVAEIPASGSPTLHLTPDTPHRYPAARFTF